MSMPQPTEIGASSSQAYLDASAATPTAPLLEMKPAQDAFGEGCTVSKYI